MNQKLTALPQDSFTHRTWTINLKLMKLFSLDLSNFSFKFPWSEKMIVVSQQIISDMEHMEQIHAWWSNEKNYPPFIAFAPQSSLPPLLYFIYIGQRKKSYRKFVKIFRGTVQGTNFQFLARKRTIVYKGAWATGAAAPVALVVLGQRWSAKCPSKKKIIKNY